MLRKRFILLGISLLVLVSIFAACKETEVKIEEDTLPLGVVVADEDLIKHLMINPAETDAPVGEIDYMKYIRPLGYLLNGNTWEAPEQIAQQDLLMWYALHEHERGGDSLAGFADDDGVGFRFPCIHAVMGAQGYVGGDARTRHESVDLRGSQKRRVGVSCKTIRSVKSMPNKSK